MAKRVEGRSDRLLECAKTEFLEMGFQDASLDLMVLKNLYFFSSLYRTDRNG